MAEPQTYTDRTEFGHKFEWRPGPGWWTTTSGKVIFVKPPTPRRNSNWEVEIPSLGKKFPCECEASEARAFQLAAQWCKGIREK